MCHTVSPPLLRLSCGSRQILNFFHPVSELPPAAPEQEIACCPAAEGRNRCAEGNPVRVLSAEVDEEDKGRQGKAPESDCSSNQDKDESGHCHPAHRGKGVR